MHQTYHHISPNMALQSNVWSSSLPTASFLLLWLSSARREKLVVPLQKMTWIPKMTMYFGLSKKHPNDPLMELQKENKTISSTVSLGFWTSKNFAKRKFDCNHNCHDLIDFHILFLNLWLSPTFHGAPWNHPFLGSPLEKLTHEISHKKSTSLVSDPYYSCCFSG